MSASRYRAIRATVTALGSRLCDSMRLIVAAFTPTALASSRCETPRASQSCFSACPSTSLRRSITGLDGWRFADPTAFSVRHRQRLGPR